MENDSVSCIIELENIVSNGSGAHIYVVFIP